MTDTERARLGLDVVFSQPALALPLAEACDVWRRSGYVVRNYAATMDGKTMATCVIYPAAPYRHIEPHPGDADVVTVSGWDDSAGVAQLALRLAAAKWPGVV